MISKGIAQVTSFYFTPTQIEMADDVMVELKSKGKTPTMDVYSPRGEWMGYIVRFAA